MECLGFFYHKYVMMECRCQAQVFSHNICDFTQITKYDAPVCHREIIHITINFKSFLI